MITWIVYTMHMRSLNAAIRSPCLRAETREIAWLAMVFPSQTTSDAHNTGAEL
jgi:hypothetical protein